MLPEASMTVAVLVFQSFSEAMSIRDVITEEHLRMKKKDVFCVFILNLQLHNYDAQG